MANRTFIAFRVGFALAAMSLCAGVGLARAAGPEDAFLAKELASRVADLDKMFRDVSITVDIPDILRATAYSRTAIKGESISLGSDQVLSIKYRSCELATEVDNTTMTESDCKAAKAWDEKNETYELSTLHPQTIKVKKVDPASGNGWYQVAFKKDFGKTDYDFGDIYCGDQAQCGKMAHDLLALYAIAQPLPPAPRDIPFIVERINDFATELTFRQKRVIRGNTFELAAAIDRIGMDGSHTRLLVQDRVCGVPEGQVCGQKANWIARRAVVVLAGLAPDVSVDQEAWLSEDGKLGSIVMKCRTSKPCMARQTKSQKQPQVIGSLEIPCTLQGGCTEMKAEIEELIRSLHALGH